MPAVAKARIVKRPAGWVQKGNLRKRARKDAIIALCRIAEEVGTSPITTRANWKHVQKLITKLQGHVLSDDATVRLRAAAEAWRDNGGHSRVHPCLPLANEV